jgi:prepilin-type N-terminal cleavage/methylation domain-containing protein
MILSAHKPLGRKGFSLTELLVVVAVIVILAGLVAGVVVKAIDASRTSTSLTTMEVIQSGLTRQLQQVIDGAKKGGKSPEDIFAVVRQAFPASINEIRNVTNHNLGGIQISVTPYRPYQQDLLKVGASLTAATEKSFLLRTILEKGPNSKVETDQLPKGALGQGPGGVDIIRDAWGDPISLEISYSGSNASTVKPKFTLSSPNTAKGGN